MKNLILAGVASLIISSPVLAQTASGSGTAYQTSTLGIFGEPLLQSFDFSYRIGEDHHIRNLSVVPNNYRGNVTVGYFDRNFDDAYRWSVGFRSFVGDTIDGRQQGSCTGVCTQSIYIPAGYKFVLKGFAFSYASGDHHIDQVGVWERNGQLTVAFNDKNNDDQFAYTVDYVLVPASQIRTYMASGTSANYATQSIVSGTPVIRGFRMDYNRGDHHISRIGISLRNGSLNVNYRDKNGDDGFTYFVDYGIL